jgi:hypothetical protein
MEAYRGLDWKDSNKHKMTITIAIRTRKKFSKTAPRLHHYTHFKKGLHGYSGFFHESQEFDLTDEEIWFINISTELYKKFLGTPRGSLESPGGFNFTEEGKKDSRLLVRALTVNQIIPLEKRGGEPRGRRNGDRQTHFER